MHTAFRRGRCRPLALPNLTASRLSPPHTSPPAFLTLGPAQPVSPPPQAHASRPQRAGVSHTQAQPSAAASGSSLPPTTWVPVCLPPCWRRPPLLPALSKLPPAMSQLRHLRLPVSQPQMLLEGLTVPGPCPDREQKQNGCLPQELGPARTQTLIQDVHADRTASSAECDGVVSGSPWGVGSPVRGSGTTALHSEGSPAAEGRQTDQSRHALLPPPPPDAPRMAQGAGAHLEPMRNTADNRRPRCEDWRREGKHL